MTNFWQKLNKPFSALAPMDNVTDYVFREIITQVAKPDVLFTEFTSSDALFTRGKDKVLKKLKYSEIQRPIVAQLWGSKPEYFELASKIVEDLGFDGIDVNMGCPDRSIMKGNSGAALINNKNLVSNIIRAIKRGTKNIPLSIKTRLDSTPDLTEEWISFLLTQEIDALILHARDAKAMSKGQANWEQVHKAVELRNKINPEIVIIGNGDVKTIEEIEEKHNLYGIDGVMIGRGIFQDPWLFDKTSSTKKHSKWEYIELLIKHTKLYQETWGDSRNFENMKKFFKVYVNNFKGANKIRQSLMETKSYEEAYKIIYKIKT